MIQNQSELNITAMLALNNAHAAETSELNASSLAQLLDMACHVRGVGEGATALIIALDQNAPYENPNFAWFKAAYKTFLYVDRVIVADSARGQGIGKALYQNLFEAASDAGHDRVVCEVNLYPPNPASITFHERLGFKNVGEAAIRNDTKTVRYFERRLASI